jgi:hypothetical protein
MHATERERTERLLATIRKNAKDEIRVTRGVYKGLDVIGVRVWFRDRESLEMRPGRDGLAFRAKLVDDVIDALQAAKGDAQ